ncbi:MAG: hypothetical protein L6427_08355, partial [Actinomycetia bacterium]|nr:hypothetical protein [Actinomycetes bacterium]
MGTGGGVIPTVPGAGGAGFVPPGAPAVSTSAGTGAGAASFSGVSPLTLIPHSGQKEPPGIISLPQALHRIAISFQGNPGHDHYYKH